MNKQKLFLLIAGFWLLILGVFMFSKEMTLRTGTEVLLKTQPVDPRDLFRGDYVILRYDISTVPLKGAQSTDLGARIFVLLDIVDGYAVARHASRSLPKDGLFITGKIKSIQYNRVVVEYGIESYFVPEGKGWVIEQHRGGDLQIKVSIAKSGQAVLKSLLVKGKEVDFSQYDQRKTFF